MSSNAPRHGIIEPRWMTRKLLGSAGTSQVVAKEAADVLPLVESKLTKEEIWNDSGREFVTDTFRGHLDVYVVRAPRYKGYYRLLALLVIVCGLASTLIAAAAGNTGGWKVAIAALGLVIGFSSHLSQIWMPAQRSVAYYHARTALIDEAWAFVFGDDGYAGRSPEDQFALFRSHVIRIVRVAGSIDEHALAASPSSSASQSPPTGGARGDSQAPKRHAGCEGEDE